MSCHLLILFCNWKGKRQNNIVRIYRNWQSKYGMAGAKPLRHFGKARAGGRKLNSQVSSNAEGAVVMAVPRESREASQHRHTESAPMQSAELGTYYYDRWRTPRVSDSLLFY